MRSSLSFSMKGNAIANLTIKPLNIIEIDFNSNSCK